MADLTLFVGVALKFDLKKVAGEFGHFARISIDVDLNLPLCDSILLSKEGVLLLFIFTLRICLIFVPLV